MKPHRPTLVPSACYEPPYDPQPSIPINLRFPRRAWWRRNLYWVALCSVSAIATVAGFIVLGIFGAP